MRQLQDSLRLFCNFCVLTICLMTALRAAPVLAIDILDIANASSSFALRSDGYRSFRVETKLDDGQSCIVGLTAHVRPQVKEFTVLLMGLGSDRWNWKPFIQSFDGHSQQSSFIALDWPQHGDTECPVSNLEDIAKAVHKTLEKFNRPVERFVGASLGVLPAVYLQNYYPDAKQLWLTPPMMKEEKIEPLLERILGISEPVHVQSFLNQVLTEPVDIPNFILESILKRIQRSQSIVRVMDADKVYKKVLSSPPKDLKIILGSKDRLFPFNELHPKLSSLSSHPIKTVPCGHDVVAKCSEEIRELYLK